MSLFLQHSALAQGSVTATSNMNTGYMPTATGALSIQSTLASLDAAGDITAANLTAASLTTQPPSPAPASNGQGMVTVLIKSSGNSGTSPLVGTLACWDSTGAAAGTCVSSAASGIIGIVAALPTMYLSTNYSSIVRMGTAACTFTGTPALGHYVIASSTSGSCVDSGSASYPMAAQPVGIVVSGSTTSGYYVFTMNDQPAPSVALAGLDTGNTWLAGTQSFSSAAALVIPVPVTVPMPTANGSVAYDSTNGRYTFGLDGLTVVPVTAPLNIVAPFVSPPSADTVCSLYTDPVGCDNSTSPGLHAFRQHVNLPAGVFSSPGKTIRITYNVYVDTSASSVPSLQFDLTFTSSGTTNPIYTSASFVPPPSLAAQQVSITCSVTATSNAMASTTLYANCTSGTLAVITVSSTAVPIPLLANNTISVTALPLVNTSATGEALALAIQYSTNVSGNSITLLSVLPEFLQ